MKPSLTSISVIQTQLSTAVRVSWDQLSECELFVQMMASSGSSASLRSSLMFPLYTDRYVLSRSV